MRHFLYFQLYPIEIYQNIQVRLPYFIYRSVNLEAVISEFLCFFLKREIIFPKKILSHGHTLCNVSSIRDVSIFGIILRAYVLPACFWVYFDRELLKIMNILFMQ